MLHFSIKLFSSPVCDHSFWMSESFIVKQRNHWSARAAIISKEFNKQCFIDKLRKISNLNLLSPKLHKCALHQIMVMNKFNVLLRLCKRRTLSEKVIFLFQLSLKHVLNFNYNELMAFSCLFHRKSNNILIGYTAIASCRNWDIDLSVAFVLTW